MVRNEAARILWFLHIEVLRELETKVNEAIVVRVVTVVADPKTDWGKVEDEHPWISAIHLLSTDRMSHGHVFGR